MAQFDVYRNPRQGDYPLLLDVQAEELSQLSTRVVVPLMTLKRYGACVGSCQEQGGLAQPSRFLRRSDASSRTVDSPRRSWAECDLGDAVDFEAPGKLAEHEVFAHRNLVVVCQVIAHREGVGGLRRDFRTSRPDEDTGYMDDCNTDAGSCNGDCDSEKADCLDEC